MPFKKTCAIGLTFWNAKFYCFNGPIYIYIYNVKWVWTYKNYFLNNFLLSNYIEWISHIQYTQHKWMKHVLGLNHPYI
jgi:hypothetical protein